MNSILIRIKRAILAGRYRFTAKALEELDNEALSRQDVAESIVCARSITKMIRSTSAYRKTHREMLYIIVSPTLSGVVLYTKGKLDKDVRDTSFTSLFHRNVHNEEMPCLTLKYRVARHAAAIESTASRKMSPERSRAAPTWPAESPSKNVLTVAKGSSAHRPWKSSMPPNRQPCERSP